MPIYEYICKGCNKEFEMLVLGSSDEISCPHCGGKEINRLMSGFSAKSDGASLAGSGSSCAGCSSSDCSSCG